MKTHCIFGDKRLEKEYRTLVTEMSTSGSAVINRACYSASGKKAAYRFINNENVTVERITADLVCQMVTNVERQTLPKRPPLERRKAVQRSLLRLLMPIAC